MFNCHIVQKPDNGTKAHKDLKMKVMNGIKHLRN